MTKRTLPVAFIADLHQGIFRDFGGQLGEDGLNDRARVCLATLGRARDKALELGARQVFACGDIFHNRRPEPALIAAVQRELHGGGVAFEIIPGNHDLVGAHAEGGNTACEPLNSEYARVINKPFGYTGYEHPIVFCVPFDARKPMAQVIEEACAAGDPGPVGFTLMTHVGVVDGDSPPWLRDAGDAIHFERLFDIMDRYDMPAAFVGNYHKHQEWRRNGRVICQVGALCPTGFGDEGPAGYGGLAVWDGKDVKWHEVPGPRFVKVPNAGPLPVVAKDMSVYVRVETGKAHWDLKGAGYAGFEEVEPAPGVLEAIDSAKPDRLLEGAEDALEEYVGKVPLAEGVNRNELRDMVLGYWRKS